MRRVGHMKHGQVPSPVPLFRPSEHATVRTLGSFYACVFLVMGIVIAAHQIDTSTGLQQQASLRTDQGHR
jgi:hypothetical protein